MLGQLLRRQAGEPVRRASVQGGVSGSALLWQLGALGHAYGGRGAGAISSTYLLSVPAAQACVSRIVGDLSTLPSRAEWWGSGLPVSPQPRWVLQPDPDMSRGEFIGQAVMSLLLNGNAYIVVTGRDVNGMPESLKVVDPLTVAFNRIADTETLRYEWLGRRLDNRDLLHIKDLSLPGHDAGLGPLHYAARTIALASAEDEFAANMFKAGEGGAAIPDAVVETDEQLDAEQMESLNRQIVESMSGTARGPLLLPVGLKYRMLQVNAKDAQIIESRQWSAQQICTVFGMPPYLIGLPMPSSMTYANVSSLITDYHRRTLRKWAQKIDDALTSLLPSGQRHRIQFDELVRPDIAERYKIHQIAIASGFKTINEVRAEEGLPELSDDELAALRPPAPPMLPWTVEETIGEEDEDAG